MVNFIMPSVISVIILYGFAKKIDVFGTFTKGVIKGFTIIYKILPTLIGLVTAVYMLRASGAIDLISNILAPILSIFGIPKECASLMILKPISGGGGLAIGSELMSNYGADSYIGRVTAVMLASSETSFYTMSIYYGSLGINKMKYTVFAAITADLVAFIMSAYTVRLFF